MDLETKEEGSGSPKPSGLMIAVEAGAKPKDSKPEMNLGDVAEASEADMALGDAVEAIQAGDKESAVLALRRAVEACMDEYGGMGMK